MKYLMSPDNICALAKMLLWNIKIHTCQNKVDNVYSWDPYRVCYKRVLKNVSFYFCRVRTQSAAWEHGNMYMYIELIGTLIQIPHPSCQTYVK